MSKPDLVKFIASMFNNIRAESSSKKKLEIFKACLETSDELQFREELEYWLGILYSGRVNFGVIKFEPPTEFYSQNISDQFIELLEQLADREITGNAARERINEVLTQGPPVGPTVLKWFLEKDPQAGFKAASANKGLRQQVSIWTNQKPQSLLEVDDSGKQVTAWHLLPAETRYLIETKLDGYRTYVVCKKGNYPEAMSGDGLPFTGVQRIINEICTMARSAGYDDFVLDGEFFRDSRAYTQSIMKTTLTQAEPGSIDYYVFALFSIQEWEASFSGPTNITNEVLRTRVKKLVAEADCEFLKVTKAFNLSDIKSDRKAVLEEINLIMQETVAEGNEGVVIKDLDAVYDRGKNQDSRAGWWKSKFFDFYDAIIIDIEEGTGKWKGMLGAFVVKYKEVVCRVALSQDNSLTNEKRLEYWCERHNLIDKWIKVMAYGISKDGSFNHAKFVEFHEGKSN